LRAQTCHHASLAGPVAGILSPDEIMLELPPVNISLAGDKLVVLWQALILLAALVGVLLLAPRLLGRMRDPGLESPSLRKRMSACGWAFLAATLLPPVVNMIVLVSGMPKIGETALLIGSATLWIALTGTCAVLMIWWSPPASAGDQRGRRVLAGVVIAVCALGVHLAGLRSLGRARTVAKRSIDRGNLYAISKGLVVYRVEHSGYPDDLRLLVTSGYLPWHCLLSRHGPHRSRTFESGTLPKDRPVDFVYVRLPEDAPPDLVWVWQPPAHHKGEGSNVLLKSGRVRWMEPVELLSALARTQQWLVSRPTTQPAQRS
jgi:hypothetical protein